MATSFYLPPSGSSFPLGTNTVVRRAVDGAGNTNSCEFAVIVNEAPAGTHDWAILKLKAPKSVTLKGDQWPVTKPVVVTIQNLSDQDEIINDSAALANLVQLTVESLGPCPALQITLVDGKPTLPATIAPGKKLSVTFAVVFNCANDADKGAGHEDYRFTAHVDAGALAGFDIDPANNDCPRGPNGADNGCGNKDKETKQLGADVLTDVVVK